MTHTTILRLPSVMTRTGIGRSTIYKLIAEGAFPSQIKLGPRSVGFVDTEVEAWIQARIDASRP